MHVRGYAPKDAVERAVALKARSTDRLRLGRVKAHADGSIQGFTARMRWPYPRPPRLCALKNRSSLRSTIQHFTY
jgi:hypothetical protein